MYEPILALFFCLLHKSRNRIDLDLLSEIVLFYNLGIMSSLNSILFPPRPPAQKPS